MDTMARRPVGIDGPGDCSCCSVEATPAKPVFIVNLTDPDDGTLYERLCGSCLDDVEADIVAEVMKAVA